MNLYLAVWSGGYGAPCYEVLHTQAEAESRAREWSLDMDEDDGDWIDVVAIDTDNIRTTRIQAITARPVDEDEEDLPDD